MQIFDDQLLTSLSQQAKKNPRLRQHFNLHKSYDEPSQRLLIAMEPGSYLRPHRHLMNPKPESFIGVRGCVALLIFDDVGEVEQVVPFGPGQAAAGIELPPGVWHTLICLQADSVLYETKQGPYVPIVEEEMAPWAPPEGQSEAGGYLSRLVCIAKAQPNFKKP